MDCIVVFVYHIPQVAETRRSIPEKISLRFTSLTTITIEVLMNEALCQIGLLGSLPGLQPFEFRSL
jgi:hypothetical protein